MKRIAIIGTGHVPTGGIVPPRQIRDSAADGFEPVLVEPRFGGYPGTPFDRALTEIGYIDIGVAAAGARFDALFLNTFGDYGIEALRSAVDIPVVGAGEAAVALALQLGRRFGIVTIWPHSMGFIYDERLRATGLAERCTGIRHVLAPEEMDLGSPDNPVERMRAKQQAMLDRIVEAGEAAIREDRAEVIVLGCTCMAPAAAVIAERLPVPVIEAMTAGYKQAELLVSLGLAQSRAAWPAPSPDRALALGKLIEDATELSLPEACLPCATFGEAAE